MTNHLTWSLVDQIAADLGAKKPARKKWRRPGRGVPPKWQIDIARELMQRGIAVSLDDFGKLPVNPGRVA
tara:strand:+ start:14451 stop:14660 length:210 start_codon:yes stop_codon:yes gene_type:complete